MTSRSQPCVSVLRKIARAAADLVEPRGPRPPRRDRSRCRRSARRNVRLQERGEVRLARDVQRERPVRAPEREPVRAPARVVQPRRSSAANDARDRLEGDDLARVAELAQQRAVAAACARPRRARCRPADPPAARAAATGARPARPAAGSRDRAGARGRGGSRRARSAAARTPSQHPVELVEHGVIRRRTCGRSPGPSRASRRGRPGRAGAGGAAPAPSRVAPRVPAQRQARGVQRRCGAAPRSAGSCGGSGSITSRGAPATTSTARRESDSQSEPRRTGSSGGVAAADAEQHAPRHARAARAAGARRPRAAQRAPRRVGRGGSGRSSGARTRRPARATAAARPARPRRSRRRRSCAEVALDRGQRPERIVLAGEHHEPVEVDARAPAASRAGASAVATRPPQVTGVGRARARHAQRRLVERVRRPSWCEHARRPGCRARSVRSSRSTCSG